MKTMINNAIDVSVKKVIFNKKKPKIINTMIVMKYIMKLNMKLLNQYIDILSPFIFIIYMIFYSFSNTIWYMKTGKSSPRANGNKLPPDILIMASIN